MRFTLAHVTVVTSTLIVASGAIGASPCIAQTRVTSLEELRRELAAGEEPTCASAASTHVALAGRRLVPPLSHAASFSICQPAHER